MSSTTATSVMIIPDADDFLKIMKQLQDDYLKYHGHNGSDADD